MMEEMQKVDESKVTHWEGDDELEKLIDEAVQAEAKNVDGEGKGKNKKKNQRPEKTPKATATPSEPKPVAETAKVQEPEKTFSVEEIDDPEEIMPSEGGKVFCNVCKVAFKTDAQYVGLPSTLPSRILHSNSRFLPFH